MKNHREVKDMLQDVTKDNFDTEVLKSEGLVVVDFWGPRCPHCLALMPRVEKIAEKYAGKTKVVKVNMATNAIFCMRAGLKIMSLPTFIFFKNGLEVKRLAGQQITAEEIERAVQEVL